MKLFLLISIVLTVSCASDAINGDDKFYTWVDEFGIAHVVARKAESKASTETQEKSQASPAPDQSSFDGSEYISSDKIDSALGEKRHFIWVENGKVIEEVFDISSTESKLVVENIPVSLSNGVTEGWIDSLSLDRVLKFDDIASQEVNLEKHYQYNKNLDLDYLVIELPQDFEFDSVNIKSIVRGRSVALPVVRFFDQNMKLLPIGFTFESEHKETWSNYAYVSGRTIISNQVVFMVVHSNNEPQPPINSLGNIPVSDLGFLVIEAN